MLLFLFLYNLYFLPDVTRVNDSHCLCTEVIYVYMHICIYIYIYIYIKQGGWSKATYLELKVSCNQLSAK